MVFNVVHCLPMLLVAPHWSSLLLVAPRCSPSLLIAPQGPCIGFIGFHHWPIAAHCSSLVLVCVVSFSIPFQCLSIVLNDFHGFLSPYCFFIRFTAFQDVPLIPIGLYVFFIVSFLIRWVSIILLFPFVFIGSH